MASVDDKQQNSKIDELSYLCETWIANRVNKRTPKEIKGAIMTVVGELSCDARIMNEDLIKDIATEFYHSWHNSPGTNTSQGFDAWWNINKRRFVNHGISQ